MQIEIDTVDLQNTLEQLYDRKVKLVAYASADGLDTLGTRRTRGRSI